MRTGLLKTDHIIAKAVSKPRNRRCLQEAGGTANLKRQLGEAEAVDQTFLGYLSRIGNDLDLATFVV